MKLLEVKVSLTNFDPNKPFEIRQRILTDCNGFLRNRLVFFIKMRSKTLFLLSGFIIKYTSARLLNIDTSVDADLINQNQVFFNRKEKFIKFDTKDNELEVELGISIPFIKVPLTASKSVTKTKNSKISINAPGLIVAGMLMLTSFLIIPLLFTSSSDQAFGFQRKDKSDVRTFMEGINDVLSRNGIDSSSCVQKSICWIAKISKGEREGSIGKLVNHFLKTWWLSGLIGGTFIEKAVEAASDDASCELKYSHCFVTNKQLQSFANMISAGHF